MREESQEQLVIVYLDQLDGQPRRDPESLFRGMYQKFAREFRFHVINVDEFPEAATHFKVYAFPKILIFGNGLEVLRADVRHPEGPELIPQIITALARIGH